jgi:hypothetical protein
VPELKNIAQQARAAWAFFASVFKREWSLKDYPIQVWYRPVAKPEHESRLKPLQWTASIINWPGMAGSANSRLEALEELHKIFERHKATKPTLPRPGTKVPIGFAANGRIRQHSELSEDFVKRILDIEWAWISDESSLWDFHGDETNERLTDKIRSIYGVDVSDISDGNLADIFERIQDSRAVPPTPG